MSEWKSNRNRFVTPQQLYSIRHVWEIYTLLKLKYVLTRELNWTMKTSKKQNTFDIKRGITFPLDYAMYKNIVLM